MDIQIAGQVIVVTGAAQGIGRTLALGLAAEGARVAVLARDRKRAQVVVEEIGEIPDAPEALALEADVGDEAAVAAAAAEIDAAWGRVDGLINTGVTPAGCRAVTPSSTWTLRSSNGCCAPTSSAASWPRSTSPR